MKILVLLLVTVFTLFGIIISKNKPLDAGDKTALVLLSKEIDLEVNTKNTAISDIILIGSDLESNKAHFQVNSGSKEKIWVTEKERIIENVYLERIISCSAVKIKYYYGDKITFSPKSQIPVFCSTKTLHQLAFIGDIKETKKYLSMYNVNEKDCAGMTPFLWAAFSGNVNIMQLMLDSHAQKDIRRYGQNAIHLALLNNQKEAVEFLISKNIDVCAKDFPEFLYESGTVFELQKNQDVEGGNNVFHLLSQTGNLDIAQLFIPYRDIINDKNIAGQTPLMIASKKATSEYIKFLLKYGAEINASDCVGRTSLHYAVLYGKTISVKELLQAGAELLEDNDGNTPTDIAIKNNQFEIEKILVQSSCND